MTLDEFLDMAKTSGLAPQEDLEVFAVDWRWHRNRGDEGFGEEDTPEDWIGGFECWRVLKTLGLE